MAILERIRRAWNDRYLGPRFSDNEWVEDNTYGSLVEFSGHDDELTYEQNEAYRLIEQETARTMLAERAGKIAVQAIGNRVLPNDRAPKPHLHIVPELE